MFVSAWTEPSAPSRPTYKLFIFRKEWTSSITPRLLLLCSPEEMDAVETFSGLLQLLHVAQIEVCR